MEKQNRHISASEVNVYLSAGGYLGDKFQDKYFFVWPGSQRFNLDSCDLVQAALGRIELLQDFTMTHSDTIPRISGYKKNIKQTNAVFLNHFLRHFCPSIIRHHKTRSPPTRMCAAVYVTPLLIFALARRCF